MVGSLESIAESVILENLNDKTTLTNLSWVKPGRAVWNFGGEDFHSDYLSMSNIKKYIDWAKQQGWEYFTLDKCWEQRCFVERGSGLCILQIGGSVRMGESKLASFR